MPRSRTTRPSDPGPSSQASSPSIRGRTSGPERSSLRECTLARTRPWGPGPLLCETFPSERSSPATRRGCFVRNRLASKTSACRRTLLWSDLEAQEPVDHSRLVFVAERIVDRNPDHGFGDALGNRALTRSTPVSQTHAREMERLVVERGLDAQCREVRDESVSRSLR